MEVTDDGEISTSCCSTPTQDELVNNGDSVEQPAPPGTNETEEFPFLKYLRACTLPLIGLEFVIEWKLSDDEKSYKYKCLLCSDNDYNRKAIFRHLTSQKHYLTYLENYFPKFFSLLDVLKSKNLNDENFAILVSHLIGKLEEKYGLLRPTIFREAVLPINSLKEIISASPHFRETVEDEFLKSMLTEEYVENIDLLHKNFPVKSKCGPETTTTDENQNCSDLKNESTISAKWNEIDNINVVPMDLVSLASPNRFEIVEVEKSSQVSILDPNNFDLMKELDVSTVEPKKMSSPHNNCEKVEYSSSLKMLSSIPVSSSASDSSVEKIVHSNHSQVEPNRKRRRRRNSSSLPRSPCREYSRSRSPVQFPVVSKSRHLRNFRKLKSSSSSSSSSLHSLSPRYRSRSPLGKNGSSLSSSRVSSGPRRPPPTSDIICRNAERRSRRGSFEYHESVREIKCSRRSISHSRSRGSLSRSRSPIQKYRKSSRSRKTPKNRRSASSSPGRRLRRLLAHQNLPRNTECVVRVDTSKRFASHRNGDGTKGVQREISCVTSEVTVELKSKVNSREVTNINEEDKMNIFKKKIRHIKKRLRGERRDFRKHPEAYPMFEDEWKVFYQRRFKEVQNEGVNDPYAYDYKPDWMRYWLSRVKEIYGEKYKKLKADLKENLGILKKKESQNVTNVEVVELSDGHESNESNPPMEQEVINNSLKANKNTENPKVKSDDCEPKKEENVSVVTSLSSATVQQQVSLFSQAIKACMSAAQLQNPAATVESPATSKSSQSTGFSCTKMSDDSTDVDLKDDCSFISVLRQLTVLESQLGSFANQITGLLAEGLTKEKNTRGSSASLLTGKNLLFLDIVKEKLRGQLILEVVPDAMVKATKRCIKSIDELAKLAPLLKPAPVLKPARSDARKIPDQASASKNPPLPSPVVTHTKMNVGVNVTRSQEFPISTAFEASFSPPVQVPAVLIDPRTIPSDPRIMPAPPVQVLAPPRPVPAPMRPETYPPSTPFVSTSSVGQYPAHSVNSVAHNHSNSKSRAPVHLSAGGTHDSSNQGIFSSLSPHPNRQHGPHVRSAVQSAGIDSVPPTPVVGVGLPAVPHPSKQRSDTKKKLSIYDKIPWREQFAAAAFTPAAGPPSCSSGLQSTQASSSSASRESTSHRPEESHSGSPAVHSRAQLTSALSTSHVPAATSTSRVSNKLPASQGASKATPSQGPSMVPATLASRSSRVPAVNLHSENSQIHGPLSCDPRAQRANLFPNDVHVARSSSQPSDPRLPPVTISSGGAGTSTVPSKTSTSSLSQMPLAVSSSSHPAQVTPQISAHNYSRVPTATSSSDDAEILAATSADVERPPARESSPTSSRAARATTTSVINASVDAEPPVIDLTDDEINESADTLPQQQLIQMLVNFKQLPPTRQRELIDFMRKLEDINPEAVESLKKYVKPSS